MSLTNIFIRSHLLALLWSVVGLVATSVVSDDARAVNPGEGIDPRGIVREAERQAEYLEYYMSKEQARRHKANGPKLPDGTRISAPSLGRQPFNFGLFDFHATETLWNVEGILREGYRGYPWTRTGWVEASHGPYVVVFDGRPGIISDRGIDKEHIIGVVVYADPGDQISVVGLNLKNSRAKTFAERYVHMYLPMLQKQRSELSTLGQRMALTKKERYLAGGTVYAQNVERRFDRRFGEGALQTIKTSKQFGVGYGSGLIGDVAGRYLGGQLSGGDVNWQSLSGFMGSQATSTLAMTAWSGQALTLRNFAKNGKGGLLLAAPLNATIEMAGFVGLRPQFLGGRGWFELGPVDSEVYEARTRPDFSGGLMSATGSYLNSSLNAFSDPLRSTWNVADSLINPYAYYVDAIGSQPGRTLIGSGIRTISK